ncbi:MAG TPA: hypothetical protein VEU27_04035 [Gemmatimonadales bacterium]|jgi:hypothetical protein|nr:hypothetical protein [Gemmatimonadales bacterium]
MTHTLHTPSHASLLREIARNLERTLTKSGEEHVCLTHAGAGRSSCVCYRDAGHFGAHRCACGSEWDGRF